MKLIGQSDTQETTMTTTHKKPDAARARKLILGLTDPVIITLPGYALISLAFVVLALVVVAID